MFDHFVSDLYNIVIEDTDTDTESTSIVEFGLILLKKMLQALKVSVQNELPLALRLKKHGP